MALEGFPVPFLSIQRLMSRCYIFRHLAYVCGRCRIRTCDVPDFKMSPCGGLLFFAFDHSANLPIYICFGISFSFRKPANLAAGWVRIAYVLKMYIALNAYETKINLKNLLT